MIKSKFSEKDIESTNIFIDNVRSIQEQNFIEIKDIGLETLFTKDSELFNRILWSLNRSASAFDRILFDIYKLRKVELNNYQKWRVVDYLTSGYILTKDVRYFNELLWQIEKDKKYRKFLIISSYLFHQNIIENKYHSYPKDYRNELENVMNFTYNKQSTKTENVKIALLGFPLTFRKIFINLIKLNYNVHILNVQFHSDRIRNIIVKSVLLKRFLKIFFKSQRFTSFTKDNNCTELRNYLSNEKFDIGISRLGFIIKPELIDSINDNLLHSHNGVLPFFRGRSVLEYSILHGFPIGSTIHKISTKIDRGDILCFFEYKLKTEDSSIQLIKKKLSKRFNKNILHILTNFSKENNFYKNKESDGLTYWSIHPSIYNYIDKMILK